MGMIVDMILAVAMIAPAPGAIAELQFRITNIGAAADGAFVMIRRFNLCGAGFIGTGIGERNGAGTALGLLRCIVLFLSEQATCVGPPGQREHILDIGTEEQEIVCQSNQGKEIDGEQKVGDG